MNLYFFAHIFCVAGKLTLVLSFYTLFTASSSAVVVPSSSSTAQILDIHQIFDDINTKKNIQPSHSPGNAFSGVDDSSDHWLYWQFFFSNNKDPILIAGYATNFCIISYAFATFKFSYVIQKGDKEDTVLYSYYTDNKCQKYSGSSVVSFSDLQSTIYENNHVFNAAKLTIAFSSDLKPPVPLNVSFATNFGSKNTQVTQFIAYAEDKCIPVVYPGFGNYKVYIKYTLPYAREYYDAACKVLKITEILTENRCVGPLSRGSVSNRANVLPDTSFQIDFIVNKFYKTSIPLTHSRFLANAPTFDDDLWQPFDDDTSNNGNGDPQTLLRTPIQVFMRWKRLFNSIEPGDTLSPSESPTMAPTNKLVFYQLTVIQRVRNITATALIGDDLARAVFIQSIAVLINLPYDTIRISRIDSIYTAVTTTLTDSSSTDSADLQPAISMFAEKPGYLRRGGEVMNTVPDLLSVVPHFAELEKSPEQESEFSAEPMDMVAGRALTGEVNECFVTYVIEFSPAQLFNITDPVVAVKWIKDKLTKRVTSGIQQFALMYFASNKDVVSMYPVTVDSAPIFSTNVPVRDSSTHSAQELSAMNMALAIGFGIFGLCLACCCSRIVCKNRSEYEVAPMLRPDAEDADHQRYIERVETENYRHYSMVQVTKPRPAPPTPEQLEQVRLQQEAERQQQEALAARELQRAAEVRERIEKKRKIDAEARIAYEEERKRIRESGGKLLSMRQQIYRDMHEDAKRKAEAEEAVEEAFRVGLMEQMFINENMSEKDIREYRAGFAKEKRKAERLKEIRASCYNKLRKAKPMLFPDGDGLMSREAMSLLSSAVARQLSKEDNFPYQSYTGSSDGESTDNNQISIEPEAPPAVAPCETPAVLVIAPVTPKKKKVKREYRRLTDAENNARMEKALLKAQAYYRRKNEVEAALSLKLTESEEENEENDEKADAKEAVQLAVAEEYLDVVVAAQQAEEQEEKVNEDTAGAAVFEEKADDAVVLEVTAQNEGVSSVELRQLQSDPRSTYSNGSNGSDGSDEHSATVLPPMHLFKLPTGSGIATAGSHTKFF